MSMRTASRLHGIGTETADGPRHTRGDIDSEAREWLAYLYSGEATVEGQQRYSEWLSESAEHASAYARCERMWRDMGSIDARVMDKVGTAQPERQQRYVTSRVRWAAGRPVRWAAGAAIAAALVLSIGLWQQRSSPGPVVEEHFVSAPGEIRTVTLADGSRITLSASSSIVTRVSKHSRHVDLIEGRAYFAVAHDGGKVFSVSAGATEVRVTGTQFDVQKEPNGVGVAVVEGSVEVSAARSKATRMQAGERIVSTLDGALGPVEPFNAQVDLAWRTGRLVYVDAPLDNVLAEVNRFRTRPILLATPELAALRVTASFRTDQTDQLLSALTATQPVRLERTADGVLLKPKTSVAPGAQGR